MKKVGILALVIGIALAIGSSAMGGPKGPKTPPAGKLSTELRAAVTTKGVFKHLTKLQAIANANDGNRAAGTPGFDASANYVARKLEGYGWKVKRQPFDFQQFFQDAPSVLEQTAPAATTYAEDTDYNTMDFSGSGDVTADLVAVDLTIPPSPEPGSTSGCEAADFDGLPVAGNVVLLQRGTCDFAVKVDNAAAAGAAAAILFNEGQAGRTDIILGTLGTPVAIPALDTSFALGSELANGATNGPTGLTVHVATTTHSEEVSAENVIAETKSGDGDNVVMAGAHLDSVTEGPGINDNGTGTATLLETAKQISKLDVSPKNKIRFAWWGAEEEGLIGSTEYVAALSEAAGADIALYLNFDMIGSPNYARLIYDGNGSQFDGAGPDGLGLDRADLPALLPAPGPAHRPDRLRRSLRLRAVHRRRHPGGRSVHRRRGGQDRGRAGDLRRHGRRGVRPLLPPGVRHGRERQSQGARRDVRCGRPLGRPLLGLAPVHPASRGPGEGQEALSGERDRLPRRPAAEVAPGEVRRGELSSRRTSGVSR